TQSSPTQSRNTGAAGGCEVDLDVAPAVLPAVVVVLLLPELPVGTCSNWQSAVMTKG
ncbi:hypothetical protein A2U01_0058272, partial [Trifolium medium]|nr:hypothetical protein [Trifolium medium]